jgi:hypothetical protein
MGTKLHFVWSKTSDSPQGVVHIHDRDGELRYRVSPTDAIEVTPGEYRLGVQIAGREAAVSKVIEVSGESATVDLDDEKVVPPDRQFRRQPSFDGGKSGAPVPFTRMWNVETWTGNILGAGLRKVASLGRWDGKFPVGLPAASEATLFVRIAAVDGPAHLLVAVPASSEGAASLSASRVRSSNVTDDRALMRVESSNSAVRMLIGWRRSGAISDAFQMAPQLAAELLRSSQKKKDPVSAAIGCDFLLNVVDPEDDPDQLWPVLSKAVSALEAYERWLPDSAVLSASVAAIQDDYSGAARSLCRLESQGPPIITSSLSRAIELTRLITAKLDDDHPDRGSLNALRGGLVGLAVAADLSQQFLTIRDIDSRCLQGV